jgi:hypothetical protein
MPFSDWTQEDLRALLSYFGDNAYLQALIVIVAAAVVAKLTDWIITRFILRLTRRTKTELDDYLVRILHRPIFITVLLIGILEGLLLVTTADDILERGLPASLFWFG